MSFQIVRHEHHNIFVVNRQTYETYRFTIGDDGVLTQGGSPSDLGEARRAAVAFLAESRKENLRVSESCITAILLNHFASSDRRC